VYRDEKYVEEREKLIPIAVNYANAVVPTLDDYNALNAWNRAYHGKMNELAKILFIEKGGIVDMKI